MEDPTTDEVDEHVAKIGATISKALEGYIGQSAVTEELLERLCWILQRDQPHVDDEHLQFMVGVRHDEVVPANLYTAMRMTYGVHAPSWSECEGGSWTAPDGTCYEWRDGSTWATVAQPMSVIDSTLKVEGDEKHYPGPK